LRNPGGSYRFVDLGALLGHAVSSMAVDVNDRGVVVGYYRKGMFRAPVYEVRWTLQSGRWKVSTGKKARAAAINNRGGSPDLVGYILTLE